MTSMNDHAEPRTQGAPTPKGQVPAAEPPLRSGAFWTAHFLFVQPRSSLITPRSPFHPFLGVTTTKPPRIRARLGPQGPVKLAPSFAATDSFQEAPLDCFCPAELHASFYLGCRDAFPIYRTRDGYPVAAFRAQYLTVWRYQDGERYAQRYRSRGKPGTLDFVVLREEFIVRSDLVTVLNGAEHHRNELRPSTAQQSSCSSWPVQCAVELKMAQFRDELAIDEGEANRLEIAMMDASCKLAQERVEKAYVVGISPGLIPDLPKASGIVSLCLQMFESRNRRGHLGVVLATAGGTVVGGDWSEELEFPNVAISGGWPVVSSPAI